MPRGSGIYEDEPREHRHAYSPAPQDEDDEPDRTPDDSGSKDSTEPTG